MTPARFQAITRKYSGLRIAVVGDFCLDRYLEIDAEKKEISIETGLPVYNVTQVRAQPGGAGTILNNLSALGIGTIYPIGFCGVDGEGFELQQALRAKAGVQMQHFIQTPQRRTFTYCKPLVMHAGKAPVELNRLDSKNWTPTPLSLQHQLAEILANISAQVDAMILLSQVDLPETGVITAELLKAIDAIARSHPDLLILADSRSGLQGYPPVSLKMNRAEFLRLIGGSSDIRFEELPTAAGELARRHGQTVFITLAEEGLIGASSFGEVEHIPALPLRGEIDIVGAGDAVTANLASALAGEAELREALEIANAAASVVIHQLGTTGTATIRQVGELAQR